MLEYMAATHAHRHRATKWFVLIAMSSADVLSSRLHLRISPDISTIRSSPMFKQNCLLARRYVISKPRLTLPVSHLDVERILLAFAKIKSANRNTYRCMHNNIGNDKCGSLFNSTGVLGFDPQHASRSLFEALLLTLFQTPAGLYKL